MLRTPEVRGPSHPQPLGGLPPRDGGLQQHDLTAAAARAVVAATKVRRGESVVEVGPGGGALTAALLAAGAEVLAIEVDGRRVAALRERFAGEIRGGRLHLVEGDALAQRAPTTAWRAIANPPFNRTAALLKHWLLGGGQHPYALDLVLQLETARKLCGSDGAHTRSSALLRLVGKPWVSLKLGRDQVQPPSRVDLAVWSLRAVPSCPPPDELARIDRLLDTAFAGPHTVTEALRGLATGVQLRRQATDHGWDPAAHPRTLKPSSWRHLATLLASCGRL